MLLILLYALLITFVITLIAYIVYQADCDISLWLYDLFHPNLSHFRNKTIWITGASSGIGEQLAVVLSKQVQCNLVLSGQNPQRVDRTKSLCTSPGSVLDHENVFCLPFDISDLETHEQALESVVKRFGKVDVLINNAGVSQRADFEKVNIKVDRQLFDTNVFGTVNLTRLVIRHWMQNNVKGEIMVTSSTAGKVGVPYSSSYTASKHALHGYFECIRNEFGKRLHVTMACPGPVHSQIRMNALTETFGKRVEQGHDANSKRMRTDRCAQLMLSALANRLDEVWIARKPVLFIYYLQQYMPTCTRALLRSFSKNIFHQLRDGK